MIIIAPTEKTFEIDPPLIILDLRVDRKICAAWHSVKNIPQTRIRARIPTLRHPQKPRNFNTLIAGNAIKRRALKRLAADNYAHDYYNKRIDFFENDFPKRWGHSSRLLVETNRLLARPSDQGTIWSNHSLSRFGTKHRGNAYGRTPLELPRHPIPLLYTPRQAEVVIQSLPHPRVRPIRRPDVVLLRVKI